MKIIHFSNWAINRSGLCNCTLEQVKYERKYGIDSQISISETEVPTDDMIYEDIKPLIWDECKDADIFHIHRGLPAKLYSLKKPTITTIHGTVEFLMLDELFTNAESTPFNTHINLIRDSNATVSVNQHDYDIYKLYDTGDKVIMIHDAIDVEKYTIEGYQHPFKHHPQILFCDSLRINKHPAHIIWAMTEIVKVIPDARLTIVGLDLASIITWRNLILRSPNRSLAKNIEMIQLMTTEIRPYMRGADILINGNMSGIPSRTELEAMACGCHVVGYSNSFTKYKCNPFDIKDMAKKVIKCWNDIKDNKEMKRQEARSWVMENANMEKQVEQRYIPLYEKILKEKK